MMSLVAEMAALENSYTAPTQVVDDIDMEPQPPAFPPPSSDEPPTTKRIAQVGQAIAPTSYVPPLKSSSKSSAKKTKWVTKGGKDGGKGGGKWDDFSHVPEGCSERWTKSFDKEGNETWSRVAIGRGADWGSSSSDAPLWAKR